MAQKNEFAYRVKKIRFQMILVEIVVAKVVLQILLQRDLVLDSFQIACLALEDSN